MPFNLNFTTMKKIASVSEIKEASNGNLYVVLSFEASIKDNKLFAPANHAQFGSKELLEQIQPGMEMES